jgi:phosphotransferase system enzyme I (PtsI)
MSDAPAPLRLSGLPASTGIAIGRAVFFQPEPRGCSPAAGPPAEEHRRLDAAVAQATSDLRAVRREVCERVGDAKAEIFDVQIALLQDPELIGQAHTLIDSSRLSAAQALLQAARPFLAQLEQADDETLRSRAADLHDLTARLQALLAGDSTPADPPFDAEVIVVARDVTPSDVVRINRRSARGLVTAAGSVGSHTAILARALGLPAVVALPAAPVSIPAGMLLIVDGGTGEVVLQPSPEQVAAARRRQEATRAGQTGPIRIRSGPSATADGRPLVLAANISAPTDVAAALAHGAAGIGLYRSESAYLGRTTLPTEDELCAVYGRTLALLAPRPVVIRTLDLGGDKPLPGFSLADEPNPALGLRGLRLCLAREAQFRTQLRALLRASIHGRLRIMLPMVSVVAELRTARRWLAEERASLAGAGCAVASDVQLGVMIEVPAAALLAEQFAREAEFLSIGTNDLVQYTFAADRLDQRLGHLQAAHHPVILQLIQRTVAAGHRHGRPVGLCGEMAADPLALPLLDGLELDELSLHPGAIPRTGAALARLRHQDNVDLVAHCLDCDSAGEVADAVHARCGALFGSGAAAELPPS